MTIEVLDLENMTARTATELMQSYRDEWRTVSACIIIIRNCNLIFDHFDKQGLPIPFMVEFTELEASMRGKALMGLL